MKISPALPRMRVWSSTVLIFQWWTTKLAEAFALQDYNPSGEILSPISQEELLREQIADQLCSAIRQRLNGGEEIPFALDERRHFYSTGERVAANCNSECIAAARTPLEPLPEDGRSSRREKDVLLLTTGFLFALYSARLLRDVKELYNLRQKPRPTPEKFQAHEALPSIKTT